MDRAFAAADPTVAGSFIGHDKDHGRIEQRTVSVIKEVDWLDGDRRFPGERRLPGAACIIKVIAGSRRAPRQFSQPDRRPRRCVAIGA